MPTRSWTDRDLQVAVDRATTWADVLRRLGVDPRSGGSLAAARRRADELEISTDHLPTRPGAAPRTWSDEDLRRAVSEARSIAGVFRALGLSVGGGAWRRMVEHILRLELATDHFDRGPVRRDVGRRVGPDRTVSAWHDRDLIEALDGAASISMVMRRLGLSVNAHGQRRRIEARVRELGLPTEHLRGRGAGGGQPAGPVKRPLAEVLVQGRPTTTSALRLRLIDDGILEARCARCTLDRWLGGPIPLQLDHINGDRNDNRLENLRLLCPTCHALTDTYCGRNAGRR
jgi:hypothetical protein